MRLLILIAAIVIAVLIIKKIAVSRITASRTTQHKRAPLTQTVKCAVCGVHLAKEEAIEQDERYFCSEEHQRASRN